MVPILREIIEEAHYCEQVKSLALEPQHYDEFVEAVSFTLARAPEIFPEIKGTSFRMLTFEFHRGMPEICVLFTFNAEKVWLVDAYFSPAKPEDSDSF